MKKIIVILTAFVIGLGVCTVLPEKIEATSTIKEIADANQLAAAIKNQADNQEWVLTGSNYVLTEGHMEQYQLLQGTTNSQGWALPIVANNITIRGADGNKPLITTDVIVNNPPSGALTKQTFFMVSGNDFTLKNVRVKAMANSWSGYGDMPNKAIHIFGATGSRIEDVSIEKITGLYGRTNSGSILYEGNVGTAIAKNITMGSFISCGNMSSGTVTVTNVSQDFTNHWFAGNHDGGNWATDGYKAGISGPGAGGTVVVESMSVKVDNKVDFAKQVFGNIKENTTITLAEDITDTSGITLNGVKGVSIKSEGKKLSLNNIELKNSSALTLDKVALTTKKESEGITVDGTSSLTIANKTSIDFAGTIAIATSTANRVIGANIANLEWNGASGYVKKQVLAVLPEVDLTESVSEIVGGVTGDEAKAVLEDAVVDIVSKLKNGGSIPTNIIDQITQNAIKQAISDGESIEIHPILELKDNAIVSAVDKDKIETLVEGLSSDMVISQYLDLRILIKSENGEELGELLELPNAVTFTIVLPENLKKEGREYYIIRVHNDVVDKLTTTLNTDGTLSFTTDRFSTYALAYQDEVDDDDTDVVVVPETPSDDVVDTSDTTSKGALVMMLMLSGFVLIKKVKREDTI